MPVYEYKCSRCGAVFEKFVRLFDAEEDKPGCPACDSKETEKMVSNIGPSGDEASGSSSWGSTCGTTPHRTFG